jgi:hypothetical protein
MKNRIASAFLALVLGVAVAACAHRAGDGWITLIDGDKGMENWTQSGTKANWRAEGGAIQADKGTGKGASVLVSQKSFKDFELYVEFWAADETNSGVYLRAPNPSTVNTASGAYEVQIWDQNPNKLYTTGSLVNVASVQPIHKAGGKWNTFEVFARGAEITVKMNGVVTVSTQNGPNTGAGRFGIQFNGGPIKVRKLQVREL